QLRETVRERTETSARRRSLAAHRRADQRAVLAFERDHRGERALRAELLGIARVDAADDGGQQLLARRAAEAPVAERRERLLRRADGTRPDPRLPHHPQPA